MQRVNLPIGTSDFERIRKSGCYYIDKTGLIGEILNTSGVQVMLITRPRRFGKTLGMNMLANFFDIQKDSKALFEGLEVSKDLALCEQWRNQWPVLFVSFRRVDGLNFQSAYGMLELTITDLFREHRYLLDSEQVGDDEKKMIHRLLQGTATEREVKNSLLLLTEMMQAHYGKPVILLMDEYDVPLAKASARFTENSVFPVPKWPVTMSSRWGEMAPAGTITAVPSFFQNFCKIIVVLFCGLLYDVIVDESPTLVKWLYHISSESPPNFRPPPLCGSGE